MINWMVQRALVRAYHRTTSLLALVQRLQRLTAEAGEWARDYRARQRAAAANQAYSQQQPQPGSLRTVAETQLDAPVAALAAYSQSGTLIRCHSPSTSTS